MTLHFYTRIFRKNCYTRVFYIMNLMNDISLHLIHPNFFLTDSPAGVNCPLDVDTDHFIHILYHES